MTTSRRARDLGFAPGVLPPGAHNAITDVEGVHVGHLTLIHGDDIRTGVTAILPHGGNVFRERVPAGLCVGNGFGKLAGGTQLRELGELETPIVLTNTLSVARGIDGLVEWTLNQPGNHDVMSVNAVVGETNDGFLNDIRARAITREHVLEAMGSARGGPVAEGSIGAGTGSMCFGWKGGIGTSSRVLPDALGGATLGVLVQSNFGGVLQMDGRPVGKTLGRFYLSEHVDHAQSPDGSIMIVIATDAPLSDHNLERLAARAMAGLARTGAAMSNGSGDYAIAFSTHPEVRRALGAGAPSIGWPNEAMSPLFQAVIEATEEAILNSLFMATSISGFRGHIGEALPIDTFLTMAEMH